MLADGDGSSGSTGLVSYRNKGNGESSVFGVVGPIPLGDSQRRRLSIMAHGVVRAAYLMERALIEARVRYRAALLTFTYRDGVPWEPGHMRYAVRCYRQWCKRRGIPFLFVWCLELTKAGVPHYHMIAFLPKGITPPLPDKQGWWAHGMTNAKWSRSPVGYIAKYASKGTQGRALPKGARIWGCGGLDREQRVLQRFWRAPMWVRRLADEGDDLRRQDVEGEGSVWVNRTKGVWCRSPWVVDFARQELRWVGWTSADCGFLAHSGA